MTPLEALREMERIQRQPGNYDYNPYMHGMANGLILALATMEERAPVFLDVPDHWVQDIQTGLAERT